MYTIKKVMAVCVLFTSIQLTNCQSTRYGARQQQPTSQKSPTVSTSISTPSNVTDNGLKDSDDTQPALPLPSTTVQTNKEDTSQSSGSLIVFLQRINDRLASIETMENQQLRKLEMLEYRITKLEIIIQEKGGSQEKPDTNAIRKIEDLEWEINKFGTLLEVVRQDIDKIQHKLTEIKVVMTAGAAHTPPSSRTLSSDISQGSYFGTDVMSGLQTITSNVQSLRRMTDIVQNTLIRLGSNLTDINNMTRNFSRNFSQLLTKQYFHIAMKDMTPNKEFVLLSQSACQKPGYTVSSLPRDCSEIQESGIHKSGIYQIQPQNAREPFFTYCDLENNQGGWTVIQRRMDGSIDFYREWMDYKHGFGNIAGEFWLGNEKIHQLTNQAVYELRIELEDFAGEKVSATYSGFAIGSELDSYMIKLLGSYEGTAGDSFTYHASMKFSTLDVDNDPWEGGHCAQLHTGGWWYKGCETANLNGQYLAGQLPESMEFQGMYWYEWHGPDYSLQKSEMKIRKFQLDKLKITSGIRGMPTSTQQPKINKKGEVGKKKKGDTDSESETTEMSIDV